MKLHIERETKYVPVEINGKWSNSKLELTDKYTVFNTVGSPAYQTPVFTGTKIEAQQFFAANSIN